MLKIHRELFYNKDQSTKSIIYGVECLLIFCRQQAKEADSEKHENETERWQHLRWCVALVIHSVPTVSTIRPTVIHTLSFPSSLSHGYDTAYVNKHGQRKRERERHQEFQLGLWELRGLHNHSVWRTLSEDLGSTHTFPLSFTRSHTAALCGFTLDFLRFATNLTGRQPTKASTFNTKQDGEKLAQVDWPARGTLSPCSECWSEWRS